mmetsp:Transcript_37090/g.148009  ORF Transcript_37090/g.148009 Transcript_37090/m.148009 type:complete len:200 (-) Transcript_37090:345-944(-)
MNVFRDAFGYCAPGISRWYVVYENWGRWWMLAGFPCRYIAILNICNNMFQHVPFVLNPINFRAFQTCATSSSVWLSPDVLVLPVIIYKNLQKWRVAAIVFYERSRNCGTWVFAFGGSLRVIFNLMAICPLPSPGWTFSFSTPVILPILIPLSIIIIDQSLMALVFFFIQLIFVFFSLLLVVLLIFFNLLNQPRLLRSLF